MEIITESVNFWTTNVAQWTLGLLAVLVFVGLVWCVIETTVYGKQRELNSPYMIIAILFVAFFGLVPFNLIAIESEIDSTRRVALEEVGFSDVTIKSGNSFTADLDGSYFRGTLEKDTENPDKYTIFESVKTER